MDVYNDVNGADQAHCYLYKTQCLSVCLSVPLFLWNPTFDLDQTFRETYYLPRDGYRMGGTPGKNQGGSQFSKMLKKRQKTINLDRKKPPIKKFYKIKVAQHPYKWGTGRGQN